MHYYYVDLYLQWLRLIAYRGTNGRWEIAPADIPYYVLQ